MKQFFTCTLISALMITGGGAHAQSAKHPGGPTKVQSARSTTAAQVTSKSHWSATSRANQRIANNHMDLRNPLQGKHPRVHPEYLGLRGSAPVNDNCANATLLTVGTACVPTAGTTLDATNSIAPVDCLGFEGDADDDVWYRFVANASAMTIEVGVSTTFDAVIDLRSGACNGTNIACADDFIASGDEVLNATGLTAGNTYYVRVYDYETGTPADPTFTICVYSTPAGPANDLCEDAVIQALSVPGSASVSGDNTGATDTEGLGGASVWEAFTITSCANIAVGFCGTPSIFSDAFSALRIGCPSNGEVELTDFNATTCADGNLTLFYSYVPAGTYYYPVFYGAGAEGEYTLTFTATPCGTPDIYCTAGAVSTQFEKIANVTVGGINNNSTSVAGYENFTSVTGNVSQGQTYPISITVDGGFDTDQSLVWVDLDQNGTFGANELLFTSAPGVGPHTGSITIPAGATLGDTRMRVRLHDTYTGVDYQNTPNATPCDTSTFGQVEDYTLTIEVAGVAPANDLCSTVVPETLTVGSSITFTGDNTDATITGDYLAGSELELLGLASVWHAFTTTECANVQVSYCGTTPEFLNFWIILSTDCPAETLIFNTDFNTTACGDGNGTINFANLPAGTYYLPVMLDTDPLTLAEGPYTIEVTAEACVPGPANNECTGAIALDVDLFCDPVTGDINNATNSIPAITCNQFLGDANDDVWYSFIATGPNQVITVTGSDSLDAVIELLVGGCVDGESLACADATVEGGTEEIVVGSLIEGTTYYVRVYDFYSGFPETTTFDICITGEIGSSVQPVDQQVFSIRPNPSEGIFTIDLFEVGGALDIDLLDVAGRLVHAERTNVNAGSSHTLDLAGRVPAGMYTVRLSGAGFRSEQRLMVR